MSVLITNIQRTSFHDGDGIRTTVFFKGCNLHCPWCANPENISSKIEWFCDNSKCFKSNGKCIFNNDCPVISNKSDFSSYCCPAGAIKFFGTEYNGQALYEEVMKDVSYFHNSNGGVTFSGGEPLNHLCKIINILAKLRAENINLAVETSLYCKSENLNSVLNYIDCFYVDIKTLESDVFSNILGGNISVFFKNIDIIFNEDKKIVFRMPLVQDINTTEKNINLLRQFLSKYKPDRFEFFQLHNLAEEKYKKLNKEFTDFNKVPEKFKKLLIDICSDNNIGVKELSII